MKDSHIRTPRTLEGCSFTPGYKRWDYDDSTTPIRVIVVNFVVGLCIVLGLAAAVIIRTLP